MLVSPKNRDIERESTLEVNILLPFEIFTQKQGVVRMIAETPQGSFGIWPNRLDCVAVLVPGIISFESDAEGETHVAIDQGILVKEGTRVSISVRNAIGGRDLGMLREAVESEILKLDDQEKKTRAVLAKLETGFMRRFIGMRHG